MLLSPGAVSLRQRHRYAFWRSPEDQPWWGRPLLLTIAVIAGALYSRNLINAGYAPVYSAAVKSMSVSWKAFFFGAADPGATFAIDKLAGSFVPQALAARIFGFHQWSLALPQVIEGVISVLVMYRVVRRWAGPAAGALASWIFSFTPVLASMFGHSMEDGALTMCLVLAADRYHYAIAHGKVRSLLFAGVWVGLGFQAKMLEAWMILPALAVGYLLTAPAPLARRLRDLVLAGVVTLVVSASWTLLMIVTPAADRPYIDGSSNNSALAMVRATTGWSVSASTSRERFESTCSRAARMAPCSRARLPECRALDPRLHPARDPSPRPVPDPCPRLVPDSYPHPVPDLDFLPAPQALDPIACGRVPVWVRPCRPAV